MPTDLDAASSDPQTSVAAQANTPAGEARAERLRRAAPIAAGIAVAALAGAGLGAFALQGRHLPGPLAVSTPREVAMRSAGEMQVEVNPVRPPPVPVSSGKLEVLPPDLAAAAPAPPPPLPRLWAGRDASEDAVAYVPAEPPPAPVRLAPPPPRAPVASVAPVASPAPAAQAVAVSRCAGAKSMAEDMVCEDARLSAADRRLNRAYRAALASGAMPPDELRAEQEDWLSVREDAARHSISAVDSVYRQRIAELEDMAGR